MLFRARFYMSDSGRPRCGAICFFHTPKIDHDAVPLPGIIPTASLDGGGTSLLAINERVRLMSCQDMVIRPERAEDQNDIVHLHEEAFGPGRFAKTAYRLREGVQPVRSLSLVALDQGGKGPLVRKERLVGSIRFTAVTIEGSKGALLLGPLAVYVDYSGHRCGLRLMKQGLALARRQKFQMVLLVGDLAYYQKVGFAQVPPGQIEMPGPVDLNRLLALELQAGSLLDYKGRISVL